MMGSATSTVELKISIDIDDFNFLWGPIRLLDSAIQTEKSFITAVEASDSQNEREVECHWSKELVPSRIPKSFSLTTRKQYGDSRLQPTQWTAFPGFEQRNSYRGHCVASEYRVCGGQEIPSLVAFCRAPFSIRASNREQRMD